MLKNFLKVALRNLLRNKVYVTINTLGMGVAMACCMTAYLLIAYNIEFDDYFSDEEVGNVVKVMHHLEASNGDHIRTLVCPIVMAPQAAQEIAGITDFTRFCNQNAVMSYGDNSFYENIRFADPSFFKMFHLRLARGSYKTFQGKQSVFLSDALAKKYFAGEDPIGASMSIQMSGKKYDLVVGGVFERLPLNMSFNIDALMPMEIYLEAQAIQANDWSTGNSASVLFRLNDIDQRLAIVDQMKKYVRLTNERQKELRSTSFELIPFRTRVLKSEVQNTDLRLPIPTIALIIFSILGFIILIIACFNLTNTTLAMTGKRLKEIGIRKVVGSARSQIAFQFLIEMTITVALAVGAGVVIAQIIVPEFALMWQLQYGLRDLSSLNLVVALSMLLFVAAILAGSYPALTNSRFSPMELLKGRKKGAGASYLTSTLLVVQFSLSVIVLVAGIVFTENAGYQQRLDLGYDKESILTVSVQGAQDYEALRNKIAQNPEIQSIAGAANHIGPYTAHYSTVRIDTSSFKTNIYEVGAGYFNAVGLQIISGRDFLENSETDYESAVMVDENFALNHGWKNPIDERLVYNEKAYRVIGVVKNHLSGLKQENDSEHIYTLTVPANYSTMVVKADPVQLLAVRSGIEAEWKKMFPGKPFESKLQSELVYEDAGEYNVNLTKIFFFITILGSLLSASGIYALASLNVQKRTKEIGVRKVLGASVRSIVQLLNKEFAIILLLAGLFGSVGGYALTNALMGNLYVQHIEIGAGTLVLCSFLVFIFGIATTSGTIFRSAVANPTDTLRTE
jgi:putative ABC transport system permease protein